MENRGVAGVQYLPIRVLRLDGTEHPGYSIANILNFASLLDLDRSDFSVFPEDYFSPGDRGAISSLRKAVLKKSTLQSFHILRLQEFPEAVFVSQRFRSVFLFNHFTGYSFKEVEVSDS